MIDTMLLVLAVMAGIFIVLCLLTIFNFVLKYFDQAKMYNRISQSSYQHNRTRITNKGE